MHGWAVYCHKRKTFLGKFCGLDQLIPDKVDGYTKMVFKTRRAARKFVTDNYGYIKNRPDLLALGWRVPTPVKVEVKVIPA